MSQLLAKMTQVRGCGHIAGWMVGPLVYACMLGGGGLQGPGGGAGGGCV